MNLPDEFIEKYTRPNPFLKVLTPNLKRAFD